MAQLSPAALVFILLTVAFTVIGQLLVKLGMLEVGANPLWAPGLVGLVITAFTNIKVVLGLGCAVAAAVCWMVALSRSNLSFAYPFMALAIVLVLALSPIAVNEQIPVNRWIGVIIVCVGIVIASR